MTTKKDIAPVRELRPRTPEEPAAVKPPALIQEFRLTSLAAEY